MPRKTRTAPPRYPGTRVKVGVRYSVDDKILRGFHALAKPLRIALASPAAVFALPDTEDGNALRAALEWLDRNPLP